MRIFSHRGAMLLAPENSLESIKVARSLGVDGIEIDVRLTKDNKLAVFHDANLKRLAGKVDRVSSKTLDELRKIKLKSGSYIPSLAEAITAAGNTTLLIEGKSKGWSKPLASILNKQPEKSNFEVISFDHDELTNFKKLCPSIKTYAIATLNIRSSLKYAVQNSFEGVNVFFPLLPIVYPIARIRKLQVLTFGVNYKWLAVLLCYFFPNIQITTDAPHKLLDLVKTINM